MAARIDSDRMRTSSAEFVTVSENCHVTIDLSLKRPHMLHEVVEAELVGRGSQDLGENVRCIPARRPLRVGHPQHRIPEPGRTVRTEVLEPSRKHGIVADCDQMEGF